MSSMKTVIIYSKSYCPYCDRAKALCKSKNIAFEERDIENKPDEYAALKKRTGHMTVPQIFIGEEFIGGFSELSKLDSEGKLEAMLA